jgi:hypothetical protein
VVEVVCILKHRTHLLPAYSVNKRSPERICRCVFISAVCIGRNCKHTQRKKSTRNPLAPSTHHPPLQTLCSSQGQSPTGDQGSSKKQRGTDAGCVCGNRGRTSVWEHKELQGWGLVGGSQNTIQAGGYYPSSSRESCLAGAVAGREGGRPAPSCGLRGTGSKCTGHLPLPPGGTQGHSLEDTQSASCPELQERMEGALGKRETCSH